MPVVTEGGDVPDGMVSYEDLIGDSDEADFEYPDFDENQAAAMCYTSGTTGRPRVPSTPTARRYSTP